MSTLLLVRHAQASFFEKNYDQLSPVGEEQGRKLGEYLVKRGQKFDRAYTGPARRHRQTSLPAAVRDFRICGAIGPSQASRIARRQSARPGVGCPSVRACCPFVPALRIRQTAAAPHVAFRIISAIS